MRVLAYTYEADYHCLECVDTAFGPPNEYGEYHGEDSERNRIFPLFDTDEWWANDVFLGNDKAVLACGTCGEIIEERDLAA